MRTFHSRDSHFDQQVSDNRRGECLCKSLQAAPDYADAMFNFGRAPAADNEYAEAAIYWRRFLAIDSKSEWATRARRSMKFCKMQQHLTA